MKQGLLAAKSLFLFDLDGVFYKGKESRVKLGGDMIIPMLRAKRKDLFVLTNNSTDSVDTVHSRLAGFGIEVDRSEILTSALLTADYLRSRFGSVAYYLVGEPGLEAEMKACGHRRTGADDADFVVVGLDRGLTYRKLDEAARVIRNGGSLVATHSARLYMYKTGPAIATGPLVKAIEYATGKRATVVGKPSGLMFKMALNKAGCAPADAVMIGDQVETDIAGAARAKIDAILVTSGVDKSAPGYKLLAKVANVDDVAGLL